MDALGDLPGQVKGLLYLAPWLFLVAWNWHDRRIRKREMDRLKRYSGMATRIIPCPGSCGGVMVLTYDNEIGSWSGWCSKCRLDYGEG